MANTAGIAGMGSQALGMFQNQMMQQGQDMTQMMQQQNSYNNFNRTSQATMFQENNSTRNQIQTIHAQMRSENTKGMAERAQIRKQTMTKTSEMHRETYVKQMQSSAKIHQKVLQVMTS